MHKDKVLQEPRETLDVRHDVDRGLRIALASALIVALIGNLQGRPLLAQKKAEPSRALGPGPASS